MSHSDILFFYMPTLFQYITSYILLHSVLQSDTQRYTWLDTRQSSVKPQHPVPDDDI